MFQVGQLHSDYFDNLNKVGSVVDCLSVIVQRQFLLHICILVGVMFRFLQGRILYFWVFQLWFYVYVIPVALFRLNVSGNARFFPAVQTICKFGNFIRIS